MADTRSNITRAAPAVPLAAPTLRDPHRERLLRAGPARWRVVDAHGRVLGHLHVVGDPRGMRHRAERYHAPSRSFRPLGDFWSADEAVRTLRYQR